MKKVKFPKLHWTKILSLGFFVLLLGSYAYTFAIPPATKYNPGETLDPICGPLDPNCSVEVSSSPWLLNGSDIYYNNGKVGIGTDSPTSMLDIRMIESLRYHQSFYDWDDGDSSLNDATYSGTYTGDGDNIIYVVIDGEGSPDTFSYSDDNGDCPRVNNVPITGGVQSLCLGISIQFENITGHFLDDEWDYVISEGPITPISVSDSNGDSYFNIDTYLESFFVGHQAGYEAVDSYGSIFLGTNSGYQATYSNYSNFFGAGSGYQAANAHFSNFIGFNSGGYANHADNSNFIGIQSGYNADEAHDSNFIGVDAGYDATNASYSDFIGAFSGVGATNASYSNFFGYYAGRQAVNAVNSIFIGRNSGYADTVNNTLNGLSSILIGSFTNTGGYSNSILLGSGTSGSPISNTKANQFMLAPTITEMRLRGVDYNLPSSQGGVGTVLTNNGSGVLSWGTVSGTLLSDADYNTKGGTDAGLNLVYGAQYNTFLGYQAGRYGASSTNAAADYNTGIGSHSLSSNTTGNNNSALGSQSLYLNTTGNNNSAFGSNSLRANTTGSSNSSFGANSLSLGSTGNQNSAFGNMSLYYTTGSKNSGVGVESLTWNSTGSNNSALGYSSLSTNTTGSYNSALGVASGTYAGSGIIRNETSSNSIYLGYDTRAAANGDTNEIVIGASAIGNGSNTATIGNSSLLRTYLTGVNLKAGTATAGTAPLKFNSGTLLGTTEAGAVEYDGSHLYFTATNGGTRYQLDQQGGGGLLSDADFNTKGGTDAGLNLVSGAQYNTFLGYQAGRYGASSTNAADNNTTIGYQSLYSNTTGGNNSAVGLQSLYSNTTGQNNSALGAFSLSSNTTGSGNSALGNGSLFNNTTGGSNSALGQSSLNLNTAGWHNSALGNGSLLLNTTGSYNSTLGSISLQNNTTGSYNSALGYNAGSYIADGSTPNQISSNSLYLGSDTRALANGDTNEIVIGASAIGNGSNTAQWGNTSITNHYLSGNIQFSTYGAGTLTTDASGNITASSDERLKDIEGDFDNGGNALDIINSINPILYKWNNTSGFDQTTTYAGFSAQNIQEVIPEAIGLDKNGYLTLSDRPILATTVNAIKELDLKVKSINDMDIENDFRDTLSAWFSNATNKITRIFTGEICLTDPGEESECINRSELIKLKALISETDTGTSDDTDTGDDTNIDDTSDSGENVEGNGSLTTGNDGIDQSTDTGDGPADEGDGLSDDTNAQTVDQGEDLVTDNVVEDILQTPPQDQ